MYFYLKHLRSVKDILVCLLQHYILFLGETDIKKISHFNVDSSVALSIFSILQPTPLGSKTLITTEGTFTPTPLPPQAQQTQSACYPHHFTYSVHFCE